MKSFGTRLSEPMEADLLKAAEFTGLRPADLLRIGARMVVASIKKNGGLRLGEHTRKTTRPAATKRRAAK